MRLFLAPFCHSDWAFLQDLQVGVQNELINATEFICIQAIARAHRYGQKKTCLVFKLMVKDSAEGDSEDHHSLCPC